MRCRSLLQLGVVWLVGVFIASFAQARPPLPGAKDGHDLRGPALKMGMKLTVNTTITMKDADLRMSKRGGTDQRKLTTIFADEQEVDLIDCKGRQPTRLITKVVKGETRQTYPDLGWPPARHDHQLAEKTVVSRWEKGKWDNTLARERETEQLRFVLSLFDVWSPGDQLVPDRPVRVESTWVLGPRAMTTFPCAFVSPRPNSFKVFGMGKLRTIVQYQGQPCAVIDYSINLLGKEPNGRTWVAALKMTVHRSLRQGINLKVVTDSEFQAADVRTGFRVAGKQKTEVVTTVKD